MKGCPWVLPRPVYVLAFCGEHEGLGGTYTLRTKVEQQGASSELAKVSAAMLPLL